MPTQKSDRGGHSVLVPNNSNIVNKPKYNGSLKSICEETQLHVHLQLQLRHFYAEYNGFMRAIILWTAYIG